MLATQPQDEAARRAQLLQAMLSGIGPAPAQPKPTPVPTAAPPPAPTTPQLFPPPASPSGTAPVPVKPFSVQTPGYGSPAAAGSEASYLQERPMGGGTAPTPYTPETGKHAVLRSIFAGLSEFGRPGAGFAQNKEWNEAQLAREQESRNWPLQREKNIQAGMAGEQEHEFRAAQIESTKATTQKNASDVGTVDELAARIVSKAEASGDAKQMAHAMEIADRLKSMGKNPGKWTLQRDPTGNVIGAQSPDGQIMPLTDPNVPQGLLKVAQSNEVKPEAVSPVGLAGLQAGPKPTTNQYDGKTYPDVDGAVNAWAQKAQQIYVKGQQDIAEKRGEAYGGFRGIQVIDPADGMVKTMYTKDAVAAGAAGATPGASLMSKEAQMSEIKFASTQAREAIDKLEPLDAGSIATLTMAMRETEPTIAKTLLDTLMGSQQLTPHQRAFVTWIGQINERAMSLRSIAGMGAGAQDLREAIRETLPGLKSGDKSLMLQKLDAFDNQVKMLEQGIPKVNHPAAPAAWKAPADAPAAPKEDGHRLLANGKEIAVSKGGQWVQPNTP